MGVAADDDASVSTGSKLLCQADHVLLASGVVGSFLFVGQRSIVGAGAVVTQDVPPNSIAFGVPAEVQKERKWGESESGHEG